MNLYTRSKTFPPILVRLLARTKYGKPLTTEEIAKASKLSVMEVEIISQSKSWEGIDVLKMEAFTKACRVSFTDTTEMRRVESYLRKKPTFLYLRKHDYWRSYYLPLLKKWGVSAAGQWIEWKPLRQLVVRLSPLLK
jgi:hypothetical protein